MCIYEILQPGTWLEPDDQGDQWELGKIISNLVDQFYDANLALNLFIDSYKRGHNPPSEEQFQTDSNRRSEIRRQVELKYNNPHDHAVWDEINLQTEVTFKREQWQSGKLPRKFEHNQSFIYARAFLYALDSFDKFLDVLKKQSNVPSELEEIHIKFGKEFPDLRGVRNSAQHMEDRSRGLGAGRNPKPLELKPIDNRFIKSEGGAIVLNGLNGTKYGNTMADGHYGEVDVSPQSMEALCVILQDILEAFKWTGSKKHFPN